MRRLFFILCSLYFGLHAAHAQDITVFAAASLQSVLHDIAPLWANETGGDIRFSFAGSAILARQVQAGAHADIIILANRDWMDALDDTATIDPATRVDLLTNRLVVIGRDADPAPLQVSFDGTGRIALALVDAIPAGIYARSALETLGLWDELSPRVVELDHVRAALALVAAGAVDRGIVYATDAQVDPRVQIIADIPPHTHAPIIYPAAAIAGTGPDATRFITFLQSPAASDIFTAHGFGLFGLAASEAP